MINLDNRLLDKLTGSELAIFCHILKRISKEKTCFPSRQLLQKETGFGREKVASAIKGLIEKKMLSVDQEKNKKGKFGKTVYKVMTKLAGIYISADGKQLTDNSNTRTTENRATENRATENPHTEKQPLSIVHLKVLFNLSIDQFEVKTILFLESIESDFFEWLQYRRDIKKTYKSQLSFNKFVYKLQKLSNNNPETAKEILANSIANGWQGIFEIKKDTTQWGAQKNQNPYKLENEGKNKSIIKTIEL